MGAVEAVHGYVVVGAVVAVLGAGASALAVVELHAGTRWPFADHDGGHS